MFGLTASSSLLLRQGRANALSGTRTFATKKAGGSTKNNSGSPGQRLGLKKCNDQPVVPGNIIMRQRGRRFWEGDNVGCSRDFTLWALVEGRVRFESIVRKDGRKKVVVHVTPLHMDKQCVQYTWEH